MNPSVDSPALTPPVRVDADHPWLGLASFTEDSQRFFFGRDAEIAEIFVRVRDNSLTILYGQSGLGKSSLLGAGLLPKLRVEDYRPVQIRLRYDETDPPLLDQVFAELGRSGMFDGSRPANLWERLHHRETRPADLDERPPVLIFDQFEEIFTLGQRTERMEEARALFTQLAELIENRTPAALRGRFQEDRRLARDYDNAPTPARLVITLREEFLSHLERWKKVLPSLMKNRMALDLLNGPQALEAVVRPGRMEGRHLVDDDVGAAIVRFVAKKGADTPLEEIGAVPPLLSLVCDELNRLRLAKDLPTITAGLVESQSGEILANFYTESFANLPAAVRHFIEDRLVTEGGHRNPVAQEDALTAFRRAGVENPTAALDQLVARRLISPEERGGLVWIEITHDVLAPLVVRSRDERLERERAAEAERREQEARKARNKLRFLLSVFSVLTLLAVAGAIYGWVQTRAALRSEEIAKAEALRAESALVESGQTKADLQFERGKIVMEQARSAAIKGDNLTSIMLAGKAVGFHGYGWEEVLPNYQAKFPPLLKQPLNHNSVAEAERQTELKAAATLIDSLNPSFLPCWGRMHEGGVLSVAFSPDGTKIASGSEDSTVKLWDAATGKELATLKGHEDAVLSVAFSPDGTKIASGSRDKTVKLWDVATAKELATLEGHEDAVLSVAFSPAGRKIASGSRDKTVKLWDAATGKELATLKEHESQVTSVAFSPDGTKIASGTRDKTVKLWDAATGKELATLKEHESHVTSVAFSPDATKIASGSVDNTVKLWDAATAKELGTLKGHDDAVLSVAFSPDGTKIASGSEDSTVKLWDAASGRELATLKEHESDVTSVAFSPDGTRIASGSVDKTVKLWDAAAGKEKKPVTSKWHPWNESLVKSVAFSPDGTKIASGSVDNSVKLWDAATGKELATFKGHEDAAESFSFSRDGKTVTIRPSNENVKQLMYCVAFSPDGTKIASGCRDSPVKLWDAATGKELATLKEHESHVTSVVFSPDGTKIASGSWYSTVKLWDAATGKELATFNGHEAYITSVAFSPDGTKIASGSVDKTVKLWDAPTGKELAALKGHEDYVTSVAFSPDGTKIASGSQDSTVKLWDAPAGKALATLKGHEDYVTSIAFSPDGTKIASGSRDKNVKLWDAATGKELDGDPDFALSNGSSALSADGKWWAEADRSAIRINRNFRRQTNLLHFVQQDMIELIGREVVWKKVSIEKMNASAAIQYGHPLARLSDPDLPAEEGAVIRLRLCVDNWRAALAVWRHLITITPTLTDSVPARRELLIVSAGTLQQFAQAEKPTAPPELVSVITENLRPKDFLDLRVSIALAQAAQAILNARTTFTPPLPAEVRDSFLAHLAKTAPQSWREAILQKP